MAAHNELGKAGEEAAVAYLESKGYFIRDRNWRHHHLELDIVAMEGDELVVVEVRTLAGVSLREPYESIDRKKVARVVRAADAYIRRFGLDNPVRFDVLSVVCAPEGTRVEHIKEAFSPCLF